MYNMKIVEYATGCVQIRIYSNPIGSEKEQDEDNFVWLQEPFEGKKVKAVTSFKETELENRRKSLSRTKQKINQYARCYKWEFFATFTFNPAKVDRSNFKEVMKKTRYFLQNLRKRYASELKYLVVPELHQDLVSWHVHALLADIGNTKIKDSGCKDKSGNNIYNIENWKWGFSTATRVIDTNRINQYIVKYVTKESHLLSTGAHRYYVSNNIPLPKVSKMLVEPNEQEDVLEQLAVSFGLQIVYCSPVYRSAYTDVTYYELQ